MSESVSLRLPEVKLPYGKFMLKLVVPSFSTSNNSPYPGWYNKKIPCRVLYDYPRFYVVRVEVHENGSSGCFGLSQEYNVTVDKRDLALGLFQVIE